MLFKQKANQQILILGAILLLSAFFCFLIISVSSAWTGPTEDPPDGNVDRPLNEGTQFVGDNGFISGTINFTDPNTLNLKVLGCTDGEILIWSSTTRKWGCGGGADFTPTLLEVLENDADASAFINKGIKIGSFSASSTWMDLGGALTAGWLHATSTSGTSVINHALQIGGKIKIMGGSPGIGKVLVATSSDGWAEWVTSTSILAGLPTGTVNQTLRHDGTGWVASSSLLVMATSGVAIASDLFMTPSKAIRVDGSGTTNLYIGNWGTGATGVKLSVYGNIVIDTNNDGGALISTYKGAGSDGKNIFIGGGGQFSTMVILDPRQGSHNTAIGQDALYNNTSGSGNIANGWGALYNNTSGFDNIANGWGALYNNTSGFQNTANGWGALYTNSTGTNNTANGRAALYNNSTGANNTANGWGALYNNTSGNYNIAIGIDALSSNITGSENIGIGPSAGDNDSLNKMGNRSIFIGRFTEPLSDNQTNQIVIGYQTVGLGSNTVVLGNNDIVTTALKGNVGIGTTTPNSTLHVARSFDPIINAEIAIQSGVAKYWAIYQEDGVTTKDLRFWNADVPNSTTSNLGVGNILVLKNNGEVAINNKLCLGGTCKSSWDVSSVYVGKTATSSSNVGGYGNADDLCKASHSDSHVCSNEEIFYSMRAGVPMSGNAWVNSGAIAGSNDCIGWTTTTPSYKAAFWQLNNKNSIGWTTGCNASLPFACCK